MPTLDLSITAGADDGESRASGAFDAAASRTALGLSQSVAIDAFYRFVNVTIPSGATIDVAYLTYVEFGSQNLGSILLNIYMNDVDDAVAPTSRATHDGKARTAAFTAYDAPPGVTGVTYNTPDFAAAVQEVVDRAGWVFGNDMMVLWDDDGSAHVSNEAYIQPASLEHATFNPPSLHIEYSTDSSDPSDSNRMGGEAAIRRSPRSR